MKAAASLSDAKSSGTLYNRILAILPERELDDVSPHFHLISVKQGQVLYEPWAPMQYAYFLNSGLDSIVAVMTGGESTEVAVTGREGFLGAPLLLGVDSTPYRALVQVSGEAFAIKAETFTDVVQRNKKFREVAEHFVQAHTVQAMQTSACNCLHAVEQRLARWLLLAQDRLGSSDVPLTQEFLATMLGIRRESVTVAVKMLERCGCIDGRRGLLTISDRARLEEYSCECYRVVRQEFDRLLFNKEADRIIGITGRG
jgi:CRP-like cAMP-binding protein